jgi:tRNA nucleotidyltransferase (CCA-adding enzyme)
MKNVKPDRVMRNAALFFVFGVPKAGTPDEIPRRSVNTARDVMKRLRYDNNTIHGVADVIRICRAGNELTAPEVRRMLSVVGTPTFERFIELLTAEAGTHKSGEKERLLENIAKTRDVYIDVTIKNHDCVSLHDLAVSGNDIKAMGVEGKDVGRILRSMFDDVLDSPEHNTKKYLMGRYMPARH